MEKDSTILLSKEIISMLKKVKDSPRQTYNEIIKDMILLYINAKKKDNYDKFLHEIQKSKMKEVWDNKEDEIWENA
jgi:chaperonin GroEL (HSP60 family)